MFYIFRKQKLIKFEEENALFSTFTNNTVDLYTSRGYKYLFFIKNKQPS